MKRQISYKTFNYDESYEKLKHVNYGTVVGRGQGKTALLNNKNYSSKKNSLVRFIPTHHSSFDGAKTNHGEEIYDNILTRNSQFQALNSIRLQLVVGGDSNRRVGELVEVRIPAIEEQSETTGGALDKMLSGTYLIAKIKHIITSPNEYDSCILLIKDSFSDPLPEHQ